MNLIKQIKALMALDTTIVIFSAWMASSNLLLRNTLDYRLFFLSLALVFLAQFIYKNKKNRYWAILLPVVMGFPFLFLLSHGVFILINLPVIVTSVIVNLALDEVAPDYEEYKSKTKLGALIMVLTALISLGMDNRASDYLYRFIINYMVITIMLLRESRAYCFKVVTEEKGSRAIASIALKYCFAIASTVLLATDWILYKSLSFLSLVNHAADIVIGSILGFLGLIIAPVMQRTVDFLKGFLVKTDFTKNFEDLSQGLTSLTKKTDFTNGGATAAENIIVNTTIKLVILFIIAMFIIDAAEKMKRLRIRNEQYTEEKEKIDKNKVKRGNKKYAKDLLHRIFKRNISLRDRILITYRDFERVTLKAEIFKPFMTATQLKTNTKEQLEDQTYLDDMTDVYNEVKFSNREAHDEQLKLMKKAYESVKEQL